MKRLLAILVVLTLCVTALSACGSSDKDSSTPDEATTAKDANQKSNINQSNQGSSDQTSTHEEQTPVSSDQNINLATNFTTANDIAYVLIYNPQIYDESSEFNRTASTGDFGEWVDPDAKRASELDDDEQEITTLSQADLMKGVDITPDLSQDRASVLLPTYSVGDKHTFYYDFDNYNPGQAKQGVFECAYEGEYCYIWVKQGSSVDRSSVKACGNEFDKNIYTKDVQMFGEPRYADEGGKISILLHTMSISSIGGYFWQTELYTSNEIDADSASYYKVNLDHAIIHINSDWIKQSKIRTAYSTLAHEFQHLINFSAALESYAGVCTSTWLNESMSGYAEEVQYPGIQLEDGRYDVYESSDLIRNGQSLYNFTTNTTYFDFDIGVYGSVYLFSEYFSHLAGSDAFSKTLNYWRTTRSMTLDDAEALYHACSSSVVRKIESAFSYPSSIKFDSKEQQWMSKLTLSFYMSMMKYDTSDPAAYRYLDTRALLYDEINPAMIEGGGRVIVATKDGRFVIPASADKPLVFIGYDKDFNQITVPVYY